MIRKWSRVVFERMVDNRSPHGNYDLYLIKSDGTNLIKWFPNVRD
jgi:hypothetical protein